MIQLLISLAISTGMVIVAVLTPADRKANGRIGALRSWARTVDRTARTAPATAASMARFEREVDPDGVLTEEERARRAEFARKAYFAELARKSAAARRKGGNAA